MGQILKHYCRLFKSGESVFLVNTRTGIEYPLHPLVASIITMFSGSDPAERIIEKVIYLFNYSKERAAALVNSILLRYVQFFDEYNPLSDEKNENRFLNIKEFIYKPRDYIPCLKGPAPVNLVFYATSRCNRSCIYCYLDAEKGENVEPTSLSLDEMKKILDEASDIGVCGMLCIGGEPFLRKDLTDILEYAASKKIRSRVVTKAAFDEARVARLKAIGTELQFSYDTMYEKTAAKLTGNKKYWKAADKSLRLFIKYGLDVIVCPVVTALNIDEFEDTIRYLQELGVKRVYASRYSHSEGRNSLALSVTNEQWNNLCNIQLPNSMEINFATQICNNEILDTFFSDSQSLIPCAQGTGIFTIRYDGKGMLCDHLVDDDLFLFGDLRKQSIMEVWNSDFLNNLICPENTSYHNTPCEHCDEFKDCSIKMTCIKNSHYQFNRFFIPELRAMRQCNKYRDSHWLKNEAVVRIPE